MEKSFEETWGKLDWNNTPDNVLVKQVTNLAKEGADLGYTDADGNTILHLAARAGRLRTVKKIIDLNDYQYDIDLLDLRNNNGQLPLHCGAMSGVAGIVKLLNAKRPANDEPDNDGNIPMHYAKNAATVRALLSNRPFIYQKTKITSYQNHNGRTPLHEAVEDGNIALARVLIDNHSDVNIRDADGYLPLNIAIERGDVKMIKEIMAPSNGHYSRCKLNKLTDSEFIDSDTVGSTYETIIPLCQLFESSRFSEKDKMAIAKLLIDNGAKLELGLNTEGGEFNASWNDPITYIKDKTMAEKLLAYAHKVEESSTHSNAMNTAIRKAMYRHSAEK